MRATWIYVIALIGLSECGSDKEIVPTPVLPAPSFTYLDAIDRISLHFNEQDQYRYTWSSTAPIKFEWDQTDKKKAYFKIPVGWKNEDAQVMLTLIDGDRNSSTDQTINVPDYTSLRAYGIGKSVVAEISNNVSNEWYIDQMTGSDPTSDCGPACVTMASKWVYSDYSLTIRDARAAYNSEGGWWYTSDILSFLNDVNVPVSVVPLENVTDFTSILDDGHIIILCLDSYYISKENDKDFHINKYYSSGPNTGHFIIVKGYKNVVTSNGNKVYLEVYDPWCFGNKYDDNTLKGKDRYYSSDDLLTATGHWWKFAMVVSKTADGSGRIAGLDLAGIPVQRGR